MSDKLRREIEKLQAQKLEDAAKRALDEEDFDLSKVTQQLAAYDYLLSKIPSSQNRKTLSAIAVGFACVTLAGLLWIMRTNNNQVVFDIQASDVSMTLDQKYDWIPDESLPVSYLELGRLDEVTAPPTLRTAFRSPDGDGRLVIEKGRAMVSSLVFLPTRSAESAHDTSVSRVGFHMLDKDVLRMSLKAASLSTQFSVLGDVRISSNTGRMGTANVVDSLIDPTGPPESIKTISASDGAIPASALIGLRAPMRLYNVPVRNLSFYKHRSVASAQESFISSVGNGSLTFVKVGRTVPLPPRVRIAFDGSEGRIIQLVVDNGIQLSFEGRVDRVFINDEDLTPRWLEFLYRNQPLTLIWGAVGFLWAMLWSLKSLLTGRSQSQRAGSIVLAAIACFMTGVPESSAQQTSLKDLWDNVAQVEVVFKNGETRRGFALAVAEYMNGILFVAPNTLLRDLEVPDNPTKRVSISYFSTRNISDESILLENSDATRNIGLILAPARLYNRRFVWNSQGCRHEVAPGAQVQFICVDREWHVSPGRILTAFADGRATARIGSANNSAIGSPIAVAGGIVGIIENTTGDKVQIIDLSAIESAVRDWGIPWALTSHSPCVDPAVPVNELARAENGLVKLIYRLFRPSARYAEIFSHLRPTDSDLMAIFERSSIPAVRAHNEKLVREEPSTVPRSTRMDAVSIQQCEELAPGFKREWRGFFFDIKVNTRHCTVRVGERKYSGFLFLNGHWIWLPMY
jgi:hypothetical protein